MTAETDALRLVPVPCAVLSEAAGLLDCEGYGPLALTLNNLLAAAPASPLPDEAPYAPGVTPDMQVLWDRLKENDRRCADGLQSLPLDATPEMIEAGRAQKAVDDSPGMIWLVMAQAFLKSAPTSALPTESREVLSSTELGDNGASPLGEGGGWWQDMTCDEQFALATEIAANIGYVLQPEPDHPDCPHTRQGMTKILRDQLNDKSRRLRPLPAAPTGDAG
jgi:hypothetical protein